MQSDAIRSGSEAIGGNRRQSDAIKGNQQSSSFLAGSIIRGIQGFNHLQISTTDNGQSEAISGRAAPWQG